MSGDMPPAWLYRLGVTLAILGPAICRVRPRRGRRYPTRLTVRPIRSRSSPGTLPGMTTPEQPSTAEPETPDPLPEQAGIGVEPAPAPPASGSLWLILGIALVCGVGYLASVFQSDRDRQPGGADAQRACEEVVRDRLVSPASAKFSGVEVSGSGDTFTITGNVDSDNAFGASIRNTFRCTAELNGDTWSVRVSGLGR